MAAAPKPRSAASSKAIAIPRSGSNGSLLAPAALEAWGLTDAEAEYFNQLRDKTPAGPNSRGTIGDREKGRACHSGADIVTHTPCRPVRGNGDVRFCLGSGYVAQRFNAVAVFAPIGRDEIFVATDAAAARVFGFRVM